jgi:hypothetical protein
MTIVIVFAIYIAIGLGLIFGALYISQYDFSVEPNKWRVICLAIATWPIFLMLMAGYWVWAGYHAAKNYISEF